MSFLRKFSHFIRNPISDWGYWIFQHLYWLIASGGTIQIQYMARLRNVVLSGPCVIGSRAALAGMTLGENSYVASGSHIQFAKIGRYCSIGPESRIGLGRHPSRGFISTHPAFFSRAKQCGISYVNANLFEEFGEVKIGNDVWIGAGVIVADGVTIGDGAIVAAGSVVVADVLPYHVVGGVPARTIRVRYSDEEISMLIRFAWWNRSADWLRSHAALFADEQRFFEFIEKEAVNQNA